jgi:hypothetical protein
VRLQETPAVADSSTVQKASYRPPAASLLRADPRVERPGLDLAGRWRSAPLAWRVFTIALAAQLPLIALYLLNAAEVHGKFLDVNQEGNPFTWFRSMQFLLAAAACAIAWRGGRDRWIWGPVALVMLFFSFDDVAMIHERSESIAGLKHAVMALEAGIGLIVLAAAIGAIRHLPRRPAGFLVAALLLLSLGEGAALLNDALSPLSAVPEHGLILLEQWSEMLVGTSVLAAAAEPAGAAIEAWKALG